MRYLPLFFLLAHCASTPTFPEFPPHTFTELTPVAVIADPPSASVGDPVTITAYWFAPSASAAVRVRRCADDHIDCLGTGVPTELAHGHTTAAGALVSYQYVTTVSAPSETLIFSASDGTISRDSSVTITAASRPVGPPLAIAASLSSFGHPIDMTQALGADVYGLDVQATNPSRTITYEAWGASGCEVEIPESASAFAQFSRFTVRLNAPAGDLFVVAVDSETQQAALQQYTLHR